LVKFDISIAFDNANYIIPQVNLYINSLKQMIPNDSTLHIVTTKENETGDFKSFIYQNIKNANIYTPGNQFIELKSRCKYLLNAIDVEPTKDWLMRTDLDFIWLNKLDKIDGLLNDCDIVIQPENRRIFKEDIYEERIWRQIYKAIEIKPPTEKIQFVEDGEWGLPLYNTGFFIIRSDLIPILKDRWEILTKICEKWIEFNIHPNETAFTAIIQDERWKVKQLPTWANFNPISKFRKGNFPSQELKENSLIPEDVVGLHYHKPNWLAHLMKYNKKVKDIVEGMEYKIPSDWWNLPMEIYQEKNI